MYVAMLLTDWYVCLSRNAHTPPHAACHYCRNVVKEGASHDDHQDVTIGRSEVAMWMRVVSSWICMVLYMWSLLAPVLMPDR